MSKDFHAVEFMRKRREQIDDEDRGLSWEEKARKTAELLRDDPLWKRLKSRVVEPGRAFAASKESSPTESQRPRVASPPRRALKR